MPVFCLASRMPEQVGRLGEASPVDLGFPQAFLTSDHVHGLIFGKTYDQIKP